MITFIKEIAQTTPYDAEMVVGYSDLELEKIERLYDVRIAGDLKRFLSECGRSDRGLIGDDPIVLYRSAMILTCSPERSLF